MKHTLFTLLLILSCGLISYPQSAEAISDTIYSAEIDDDPDWRNDSLIKALYAPVTACKLSDDEISNLRKAAPLRISGGIISNSGVPTDVNAKTRNGVMQIPVMSSTSPSGAKMYSIPIELPKGMNGFTPELALNYNSQGGNSILGQGWSLSGLPRITRSPKNLYYDQVTDGIRMTKDDAFMLDGVRLIKTGYTSSYVNYQTEQGNIKAKGYIAAGDIGYFEVFYPDGNKAILGKESGTAKNLSFPITSLTDLYGNQILYEYNWDGFINIEKISYNGVTVYFTYDFRMHPIIAYMGGVKIEEDYILTEIEWNFNGRSLGKYILSYNDEHDTDFFTELEYLGDGKFSNPVNFHYGTGAQGNSYDTSTVQLLEWYVSDDPERIKVVKGKFDYDDGNEGLIVCPNQNPYWRRYEKGTATTHSKKRYYNNYTGEEKIFLYAGLKGTLASPMPDLITGEGFIDIFCADIEGQQEEFIIKVNNNVVNGKDRVTFTVLRANVLGGLSKVCTREFDFPTIYTDKRDKESIQPKFYHVGDFNGDGKMEVLAICEHQPFDDTDLPSQCYVFDLLGNKLLYSGNLCNYVITLVGDQVPDPQQAYNESDKFFVIDYDGDGKSDLCHINKNGIDFYTFDVIGTGLSPRKTTSNSMLYKSILQNRDLLLGDVNGDGLADIMISPVGLTSTEWLVYRSQGNGNFSSSALYGPKSRDSGYSGIIAHDVNGDGVTDLIKFGSKVFDTHILSPNMLHADSIETAYAKSDSKTILIPANIYSRNRSTQLFGMKGGKVTKYSYAVNKSEELLLTGMIDCFGIVEKNEYAKIDNSGISEGIYSRGWNATYPYVNIQEPLAVLASTETYIDGRSVDTRRFEYNNAVIHRQGLGFRGFESITSYDRRMRPSTTTYDPYNYSVVKKEVTPQSERIHTHSVNVRDNKIADIRLTNLEEKDLLKNVSASTTYEYDTYGYPTKEVTVYSDGITRTTTSVYECIDNNSKYSIGALSDRTVTIENGKSPYSTRLYSSLVNRQPSLNAEYIKGKISKITTLKYDNHGNKLSEIDRNYSSPEQLKTTYEYDTYGRVKKITDPKGLTEEYTYDLYGRLASQTDYYGGVTTYSYDAFGRESKISRPDGTVKTTTYDWASGDKEGHLYSITTAETGKSTKTVVYDAMNREVRQSREIPVNDNCSDGIACVDTEYDADGNMSRKSFPFSEKYGASLWTNYSYDEYDRLIEVEEELDGEDIQISVMEPNRLIYSYSGCNVTTTENKITTTREYDSQGNLIAVTDPGGRIDYELEADGLPATIEADGVTINFGYDSYHRRTLVEDQCHGFVSFEYDNAGNLSKTIDDNGNETLHEYDKFNRLIKTSSPEFSTTYTYNELDELTAITSDNGTSKSFTYDSYGRLASEREVAGSRWLLMEYGYSDGNVSSIKYTSPSGVLATEHRDYDRGCLSLVTLDDSTEVYRLCRMDPNGRVARYMSGGIDHQFTYKQNGTHQSSRSYVPMENNRWASMNNNTTVINPATRNVIMRTVPGYTGYEMLEYDELNRLVSCHNDTVTYDQKGNLLRRTALGAFEYNQPGNPYVVSSAEFASGASEPCALDIDYASFKRPLTIDNGKDRVDFIYNNDYERVKSERTVNGKKSRARYYFGGCYECDSIGGWVEKLYLNGGYYRSSLLLVRMRGMGIEDRCFPLLRDHLGSVTYLMGNDNTVSEQWSYDPWGGFRDPSTLEPMAFPETILFERGYCGHEYLPEFGLINMNARLYDPMLGRFLSPDPYVQFPDATQSFNRYTYAMNNPLLYVDENGEYLHIVAGAIIGGIVNLGIKYYSGQIHDFWDGLAAFGIGAAAGGLGAATGAWGFAIAGGGAWGAGGFVAGAFEGALGSMVSLPVQSMGNNLYFGDPLITPNDYAFGIAFGGLSGGLTNGIMAAQNGRSFLNGNNNRFKPFHVLPDNPIPNDVSQYDGIIDDFSNVKFPEKYDPDGIQFGYIGLDPITKKVCYVGITGRNPYIRFAEHYRSGSVLAMLDYQIVRMKFGRLNMRIWEQEMINLYGLSKNGGQLFNKRNEILPKHWGKYGIK